MWRFFTHIVLLSFALSGCVEWGSTATVGTLDEATEGNETVTDPSDSTDASNGNEGSDDRIPGTEVSVSFAATQCIFYVAVDERGDGSGTTWENATPYLRQALEAGEQNLDAGQCDEITVKIGDGLFLPHPSDPSLSFPLYRELNLRGGYLETDEESRDLNSVQTILAGRVGEGGPQSYHVLRGSGSGTDEVRLDGLTIQEGRALGDGEDARGGGIFSTGLILSLSNVTVRDNFAVERGGGLWLDGGQLVEGQVLWQDNLSDGDGGALFARQARAYPYFADYRDNRALRGGAIYIQNTFDWFLQRTHFQGNSATAGGAVYAEAGEGLKVCRTFWVGNNATQGGGLYVDRVSKFSVASAVFTHNQAEIGASLYTKDISDMGLSHLTLTENGDVGLSNIAVFGADPWSIHNSILWRNGIEFEADVAPQLEYNLLDSTVNLDGSNVSGEPGFLAPFSSAPESWDLSVRSDSLVIDAGADGLTRQDFCNQDVNAGPRRVGEAVDIGAYEYAP